MEEESIISDGLQPQLYSVSELIGFLQNNSSYREAVCHNNFKIEREKWVQQEGERVCLAVCRGWLRLSLLSCT